MVWRVCCGGGSRDSEGCDGGGWDGEGWEGGGWDGEGCDSGGWDGEVWEGGCDGGGYDGGAVAVAPAFHFRPSINKTKYLTILGIHKSIKSEFIIKLNKDKLRNACCC